MKKLYSLIFLILFLFNLRSIASTTEHGFIGVMTSQYADQELGYGTPIDRVMDNSPAQMAGLKRGDVITALNSFMLNGGCDMMTWISSHYSNELVHINYVRDGKPNEVDVVLSPKTFTSTTSYVLDKVYGQLLTWKFRDDNTTVTIIDNKTAVFMKEVSGKVQSSSVNFDNVLVNDVKYFAIKDKIELIKNLLEKEKGGDYLNWVNTEGISKIVNFVITIDPITQLSTQTTNTIDLSQKDKIASNSEILLDVNELSVSPNPSSGIFNLSFVSSEKGKASLNVLKMEGKNVYSEIINNFNGTFNGNINISNEAAGSYIIQIKIANKQLFRKINLYN